jgi:hypothetical protein
MSDISDHRLDRLEADVGGIKEMLARIDERLNATLPHLATKAELANGLTELANGLTSVRVELADKPGKTFLAVAIGLLLAAYAAGLAALAALPVLRALHLFT